MEKNLVGYRRDEDFPEKEITKKILNEYHVKVLINPQLKEGETLCPSCMYMRGEVGIVKYAGITEGREAMCVVKYDSDGEPYTEDEYFYCRYAQWKCQKCGIVVDSEYA